MNSEGEEAAELSLERIEMTRSSGKESNKSEVGVLMPGEGLFLLRQKWRSAAASCVLFRTRLSEKKGD